MLPEAYKWLKNETGPRILMEYLKEYGVTEIPGPRSNPKIIQFAEEIGGAVEGWYHNDDDAWCALAFSAMSKRAGYPILPGFDAMRAKEQVKWGLPVKKGCEKLGDALIFARTGGGHVGLYVGEDEDAFHVIGGNQNNSLGFTRILKVRCIAARRCDFVGETPNIRKLHLSAQGAISGNEA